MHHEKSTGRDGHFYRFHLSSVHDEEVDMFIRNVAEHPHPPKNLLV